MSSEDECEILPKGKTSKKAMNIVVTHDFPARERKESISDISNPSIPTPIPSLPALEKLKIQRECLEALLRHSPKESEEYKEVEIRLKQNLNKTISLLEEDI